MLEEVCRSAIRPPRPTKSRSDELRFEAATLLRPRVSGLTPRRHKEGMRVAPLGSYYRYQTDTMLTRFHFTFEGQLSA